VSFFDTLEGVTIRLRIRGKNVFCGVFVEDIGEDSETGFSQKDRDVGEINIGDDCEIGDENEARDFVETRTGRDSDSSVDREIGVKSSVFPGFRVNSKDLDGGTTVSGEEPPSTLCSPIFRSFSLLNKDKSIEDCYQ
jgi:hypothetical protein